MAQISSGQIIQAQDFYDTFYSRFAQFANQSISYGTNNFHFPDMPANFYSAYGGPTSGLSLGSPSINSISTGMEIFNNYVKDYIIGRSVEYCRIRTVSVTRNVTASGGPVESSETRTGVSHMTQDFAAAGFSSPGSINNIYQGNIIYASNLLQLIDDCYNQYRNNQRPSVYSATYSVCHNSCHNSCHGSRGRR